MVKNIEQALSYKNLFINNKYLKWYYNIINNALCQDRSKKKIGDNDFIYYELHHILPKCLYPEYSNLSKNKWNGVLLTAKEHFICHLLLIKTFDDFDIRIKMSYALNKMMTDKRNSRDYSYKKIYYILMHKYNFKTESHKKNLSKSLKGYGTYRNGAGEIFKCKKTDPRVISGELVGHTKGISTKNVNKGMVTAINLKTGEKIRVSKVEFDETEYYVGVRKGSQPTKSSIEKLIEYNKSEKGRLRVSMQMRGKKLSQSHKEKISKSNIGKPKRKKFIQ